MHSLYSGCDRRRILKRGGVILALTSVQVKFGETSIILSYNDATGRYEGKAAFVPPGSSIDTAPLIADGCTIIPLGTSANEPGGYYEAELEIANDSGETASSSGADMASLRQVVRETTAPVITLVSPAPGFLQTQTPTFIFEAVDEEGGSGVDPSTFSLSGASVEAIDGGYRFTWNTTWQDGQHTVTASVADYDGNVSSVSGAYTVDTVPPELYIGLPYMRHVVDDDKILIAGNAYDVTAPDITVTVNGSTVPVTSTRFEKEVPLSVGENTIPITVTDGAGNVTTGSVYVIRLVTDREEIDVSKIKALIQKPVDDWTEAEIAWFNDEIRRGAYNSDDLNRVGIAVGFLSTELERRGYFADTEPKTDWAGADAPKTSKMERYIADVEAVRTAQGLPMPEIPSTMRKIDTEKANQIEAALVAVDAMFPKYAAWSSGEISCGE